MSMEIFYGMFWKEPKVGILFHGTSTVHTQVAPPRSNFAKEEPRPQNLRDP